MTTIGRCTRCRGPRTILTDCKVEAYAGDRAAVMASLCDGCLDKTTRAVVTRVVPEERTVLQ